MNGMSGRVFCLTPCPLSNKKIGEGVLFRFEGHKRIPFYVNKPLKLVLLLFSGADI
jgi:hypothetical protein